ncbi:MAG: DEAD/DEAH box helicase [Holosporales bacterium]
MNFSSLGLSQETLLGVQDAGYETPTPIQAQVIPIVLQLRDVFGCAQTGTGKTASYTLPLLDVLASSRARARLPRALVLAPTRELAIQVQESLELYGRHHKVKTAVLIGGESVYEQERKLSRAVDVLIATPGRLLDLFERGRIILTNIQLLVIDEADRMLDMGFVPDVEKIVSLLPKTRQTLFFSATASDEIRALSLKFLLNPAEVTITPTSRTAETIEHVKVLVPAENKRKALRHLLESEQVSSAIIFCNRKKDITTLVTSLKRYGYKAAPLHGDLHQSKRNETLDAFRAGEINLLIASDVAARGIDVESLNFVFNFDPPTSPEEYVHRIGRTGRAGRSGKAFTFVGQEDLNAMQNIEKLLDQPISELSLDGQFGTLDKDASSGQKGRGRQRKASAEDRSNSNESRAEQGEAKTETSAVKQRRPRRSGHPDLLPPMRDTNQPGFGEHVPVFITRFFGPEYFRK